MADEDKHPVVIAGAAGLGLAAALAAMASLDGPRIEMRRRIAEEPPELLATRSERRRFAAKKAQKKARKRNRL